MRAAVLCAKRALSGSISSRRPSIDHARQIREPDVLAPQAEIEQQVEAGERGRARAARPRASPRRSFLPHDLQAVEDGRADDDRRAVLVVVEHRDLHALAQLALDHEAFRRLDVFEIDAAESRLERGDDLDQLVRVGLG